MAEVRILFVTLGSPLTPDRGPQIRDHELIRRVARHHEVGVLPVLWPGQQLGSCAELERSCELLEPVRLGAGSGRGRRLLEHLRRGLPLATLGFLEGELLERLHAAARARPYEIVQLEHSFLAPCLAAIPGRTRTVLSLHNLGHQQYHSMARASRAGPGRALLSARSVLLGRMERSYLPRFDGVVVVSQVERDRLRRLPPTLPVAVVPNGIDAARRQPLAGDGEPGTLLFVGNLAYAPNADAVIDFCRRALPLLVERVPGVRLLIVGDRPPAAVRRLAGAHVEVVGLVEDVASCYQRARLAIVPLRAGGGTRYKVLEAMALGRCVVSTPFGVEGIEVADGREVLLAAPGAPFARRVEQALGDPVLRHGLIERGRAFVEREHDWGRSAARLLALYEQLGRTGTGRARGGGPRPEGRLGQRPRTTVVVPAYRASATLPPVLDALVPQLGREREAILVQSGVGEQEPGLEAAGRWPGVRVLRRPERLTPGQARNLGASHARGELLAFLDADAVPAPDWLDELERALRAEHDAVVGRIENGTPQSRIGTAEYLLGCSESFPRRPRAIRHGPGANLLVRRECFEALGGFSDLRAGEDTLLTFPLASQRRLAFAAEGAVRHLNRTELRPFLANQRLQGRAFAQLCATVDYPHGWVTRGLGAPLAGPLRLLALARSLAVNPVQARQALRVLPELLLGTAAWALGCLSSSDH
jgi:glycosyltransferase involved in cell wall biosynthesis